MRSCGDDQHQGMATVRTYVGVTDNRWAAFLAATGATEANFWFPSTKMGFAAP